MSVSEVEAHDETDLATTESSTPEENNSEEDAVETAVMTVLNQPTVDIFQSSETPPVEGPLIRI